MPVLLSFFCTNSKKTSSAVTHGSAQGEILSRNVPARAATLDLRANVAGRLLDADATPHAVPLERNANAVMVLAWD